MGSFFELGIMGFSLIKDKIEEEFIVQN